MSEREGPKREKTFEERVADCPIHKQMNVRGYMEKVELPDHLRQPFQELVLARGEIPLYVQGGQFGKKAVEIVKKYEFKDDEAVVLRDRFFQLVNQWAAAQARDN